MTPERWQQAKAIFQRALERPADERHGFVSTASAGDDRVAPEVALLLEAHDLTAGFSLATRKLPGFLATTESAKPRASKRCPRCGLRYGDDLSVCELDGEPLVEDPADLVRDPYLIFPTRRIRGGENAVSGGQVVELPTPYDSPPQFTISQRGEARLIAEEVIVLITPKPLELEIGPDPLRLSIETIDGWERRWGRPVERFEYESGEGMLYTAEEKAARHDPKYRISRDGPAP